MKLVDNRLKQFVDHQISVRGVVDEAGRSLADPEAQGSRDREG